MDSIYLKQNKTTGMQPKQGPESKMDIGLLFPAVFASPSAKRGFLCQSLPQGA
jgi:hypothetical protein